MDIRPREIPDIMGTDVFDLRWDYWLRNNFLGVPGGSYDEFDGLGLDFVYTHLQSSYDQIRPSEPPINVFEGDHCFGNNPIDDIISTNETIYITDPSHSKGTLNSITDFSDIHQITQSVVDTNTVTNTSEAEGQRSINITTATMIHSLSSVSGTELAPADTSYPSSEQMSHATTTTPPVRAPQLKIASKPRPRPGTRSAKVYICDLHSINTSSHREFGKHMWDAHRVKYFKCPDCDWRTARKDNLSGFHKSRCNAASKQARQKGKAPAAGKGGTTIRVSVLGSQLSAAHTNLPSTELKEVPVAPVTTAASLGDETLSQNKTDNPIQSRIPGSSSNEIFPDPAGRFAAYEREIEMLKKSNSALRERVWDLEDGLEETTIDRDRLRGDYERLKQELRKRRREEAEKLL